MAMPPPWPPATELLLKLTLVSFSDAPLSTKNTPPMPAPPPDPLPPVVE